MIREAEELRDEQPGCGVEKMYYTLNPEFIGRDRFIELFMELGYRIKYNKNYQRTTYASSQSNYPNLIEGMLLYSSNQVWQSDITYYRVKSEFYYLVFIIDVYTKIIVGYNVSRSLRATANIKALNMATRKYGWPLVHHSDRGSQYIYKPYTERLTKNQTQISMGMKALDNAYAERINCTIKSEYLDYWKPSCIEQLKRQTKKAVNHYNNKRLHNHLRRKSPIQFYKEIVNLPLYSRPKVTIYTNGYNMEGTLSPLPFYAQQNLQDLICPIL